MISVIIPVLNEEANIKTLHERLYKVTKRYNHGWEYIFVDDGSTDGTFDKLKLMSKVESFDRIKILRFNRNFGEHVAIAAGLEHCKGDCAVIMGADLQDPPEVILDFVDKWESGYEIVWGSRIGREDGWFRNFVASMFYRVVRRFALPSYPIGGTGSFCLIDRKVIDVFNSCKERNRVTFGLISWTGYKQVEMPYFRAKRFGGESKYTLAMMIKTAVDTLASFSYFPLRLASYLGMMVSLFSFIGIIYVLVSKFAMGAVITGWASLMVAILFIGGVQLVVLGIMGEYLWRIYEESKKRPLYIVSEKVGL